MEPKNFIQNQSDGHTFKEKSINFNESNSDAKLLPPDLNQPHKSQQSNFYYHCKSETAFLNIKKSIKLPSLLPNQPPLPPSQPPLPPSQPPPQILYYRQYLKDRKEQINKEKFTSSKPNFPHKKT